MKMTYWTAQTEVADILLTQTKGMSAQTQVGTLFPVNNDHDINSLSANSEHWSIFKQEWQNHGDRVEREWGLVVSVLDQTILKSTTAALENGALGIILTGQCPWKNTVLTQEWSNLLKRDHITTWLWYICTALPKCMWPACTLSLETGV